MTRRQQLVIPVDHGTTYTFDNFFPDDNDDLIQRLVTTVYGESPGSPVYFWGESGVGKTHLLNACCDLARTLERPYHFLTLGDQILQSVALQSLAPNTLICIDNLERLRNRPLQQGDDQLNLLTLYERVKEAGGNLLVAGQLPLDQMGIGLADLISRLSMGGSYQISLLSDDQKTLALKQRAAERGIDLSDAVIEFIMSRFERDIASLFALLDKMDSASIQHQRRITVPFIRSILSDL